MCLNTKKMARERKTNDEKTQFIRHENNMRTQSFKVFFFIYYSSLCVKGIHTLAQKKKIGSYSVLALYVGLHLVFC